MTITKKLIITIVALLLVLPTRGDEPVDTVFRNLYQEYLKLYSEEGKEEEFFAISQKMLDYSKENGNTDAYYRIRMNEVLYDTEHNHPYQAITRANKMLEEMKAENVNQFDIVYLSLGTIFESRGNYRMADHYYKEAINHMNEKDEKAQTNVYSRLAFLKMLREPDEAEKWNEKAGKVSTNIPAYYQVYLSVKAVINFAKNNKEAFLQTEKEYHEYHKQHPDLDNYGLYMIDIIHNVYSGNPQAALKKLSEDTNDINIINRYDMMQKILERNGDKDKALAIANERADAVDSLNSNLLFDNLNELNAEMGVAKMKREAAEERTRLFTITTILSLIIIAFLLIWIISRHKAKKILIEKNRQLETALSMADEANKMKASFIRNVTHEIRTPLNAINGFTQLLNSPDFELDEEERQLMKNSIKKNVEDITDIIDELLQVAAKESNNLFPNTDTVNCNKLCQELVDKYSSETNISVTMGYTTELSNDFTIKTSETGIRRIISQLLDNATKFTHTGSITLHTSLDAEERCVAFSVTDTGIGISKQEEDKIFEQFFKANQFTQGIGLGLSVSKMIAQKMNGKLSIDSDYTKGSRFILTLPIE